MVYNVEIVATVASKTKKVFRGVQDNDNNLWYTFHMFDEEREGWERGLFLSGLKYHFINYGIDVRCTSAKDVYKLWMIIDTLWKSKIEYNKEEVEKYFNGRD